MTLLDREAVIHIQEIPDADPQQSRPDEEQERAGHLRDDERAPCGTDGASSSPAARAGVQYRAESHREQRRRGDETDDHSGTDAEGDRDGHHGGIDLDCRIRDQLALTQRGEDAHANSERGSRAGAADEQTFNELLTHDVEPTGANGQPRPELAESRS